MEPFAIYAILLPNWTPRDGLKMFEQTVREINEQGETIKEIKPAFGLAIKPGSLKKFKAQGSFFKVFDHVSYDHYYKHPNPTPPNDAKLLLSVEIWASDQAEYLKMKEQAQAQLENFIQEKITPVPGIIGYEIKTPDGYEPVFMQ